LINIGLQRHAGGATAFMRCLFMREAGIIGALGRVGGVETEHDVIGRALLLWAAYEAGTDAAKPLNLNVEPDGTQGHPVRPY
jgi:hypothetical protein